MAQKHSHYELRGYLIMHKVLAKQLLAPGLMRIDVSAPDVAAKARPGQFVIVRAVEDLSLIHI